jgi:hypothetical protein
MKKSYDVTFRPITAEDNSYSHTLPRQIQLQAYEVARFQNAICRHRELRPSPGPKPGIKIFKPGAFFVASSSEQLDKLLRMLQIAVGSRVQGNKRIGKARLYADLIQHFVLLKMKHISLPRNKSLSRKAMQHGLGEILRSHGYTSRSDEYLLTNSRARQEIANKLDRIFSRVAAVVEDKPPPQ